MYYKDLPRPIRKAFKDVGIKLSEYCEGSNDKFRVLIYELTDSQNVQLGERKWIIRIGVKKFFCKWGNSTNFETEIWFNSKKNQRFPLDKTRRPQYTIPNLKKELDWCWKVHKTGNFNWNTYFSTIKTPWFIYD